MTEKQFLNNLINEMEGSYNPIVYGADLYLQFVESWNNPANEYSDYEKDIKNIDSVKIWWDVNDLICQHKKDDYSSKIVHVLITRKNGKKCMIETAINSNPYGNFYKMINEKERAFL